MKVLWEVQTPAGYLVCFDAKPNEGEIFSRVSTKAEEDGQENENASTGLQPWTQAHTQEVNDKLARYERVKQQRAAKGIRSW